MPDVLVDVLVVGGGPVGLAAAIEARLAGLSVTVVEPRDGAIDKACGEGLMPGAVPLLARLGVEPRGFALRGVSYHDGQREANHAFVTGSGLGVRRTTLHAALHNRAVELGAVFVYEKVDGIQNTADFVEAAGIRAQWMLACDGLHSTVARLAGLSRPAPAARRRFGLRRHYRVDPWSDLIEVHWNRLGELYVTPTADGMVGVALLAKQGTSFDEALAASPALAARVSGAQSASELRGAGPLRQRTTARSSGRVMLVGDASGYVDAITGEGLRLGFDQARAAVAAITSGADYEREWRRITRDFRVLTSGLAFVATTPLHAAVVPLAKALPGLYGRAVESLAR
jgi:flavin-dependent dehydrogenase